MPLGEGHRECESLAVFKVINDQCSKYLNELFQIALELQINTRDSY